MADPIVISRLAKRLAEVSDGTPKEGFWAAIATFAAAELERTVLKTQRPVPAEPFVALVTRREGFSLPIATAGTLTELAAKVTADLDARGEGTVWLVEVRRILEVTG